MDGVLGGYGHVNGRDVKDSNEFLVDILGERSTQNGHLVALGMICSLIPPQCLKCDLKMDSHHLLC